MRMENETIKKLTNKEMNGFECMSLGICLIRGNVKQKIKVKGGFLMAKVIDECEIHFESNYLRHELIKLTSTSIFDGEERQDWAYRVWNKETKQYEIFVPILQACDFVKNK